MTREEAIKVLTNLQNGHGVSYSEDYGLCFGHKWMQAYEMAISALREQEKRSKGRSACEMTTRGLTYKQIEYGTLRGDFINDSSGMYIIRYEGGQHSIVCDDDGTEIDIEFCPMCGRRLEEV